jgi:hypothetical protein
MPYECVSCVPLLRAKEEISMLAELAKSSHAATADGSCEFISAAITRLKNANTTTERSTVPCGKRRRI